MSTKTITLAGSEERAEFSGSNAWLRNDGTDVIYAAAKPGITAGADGVVAIPAGQSAPVYGANGAVWLTGTGSVQLVGSDYSTNPFKVSAQAGGSGADDVARAAISAHSGNAEIHVTAEEKAAWSGKAELTDIPDKLPADGGNADTLGNIPASELERVRTAIIGGETMGSQWTAIQARKDDTMIRVQADTDYDKIILGKSIDGGVTWTEIPLGNADTVDGFHETSFSRSRGDISDCNNAVLPGTYNTIPATINTPYSGYWFVSVETGANGAWIRQTATISDPSKPNETYRRLFINDKWSDSWAKVNDGGNAASVGTYTEAKIAALEARIAALEGN